MRYALLICGDQSDPVLATSGCGGWTEEMLRRGVLVGGEGLRPPSEATTVRVRDDEVLLTDGPFTETKEQLAGLCVVECADLDEAVAVAAAHPAARLGLIEVRPLWNPPEGAN
ncbi:YciI family protein [Amycolatopsis sp. H20-H5]|uniref:YciI family protein n=1 Tax=Amycolatopsis sp. H20-H5 TaxID=3046309 RepID=UPI002DBD8EF9|nr:YciI family protein [Amycolatopsis sp. H20-H5]MEC3976793.1 YciI family protein [Amycolatopsis sp. H20-H5]